jgi:hypothetical protein
MNTVTRYDYPWESIVIDDFLPEDRFNELCKMARCVPMGENLVTRHFLKEDPTPEMAELMNYFAEKRGYNKLGKFIHYAITQGDEVHPMHVEAPFKIMSAVLYLHPEENLGTRAFATQDGEPIIDVEWKPNRLFVFCGKDNITWHDYRSTGRRYTYNYFMVDPTMIENPEYRSKVI